MDVRIRGHAGGKPGASRGSPEGHASRPMLGQIAAPALLGLLDAIGGVVGLAATHRHGQTT